MIRCGRRFDRHSVNCSPRPPRQGRGISVFTEQGIASKRIAEEGIDEKGIAVAGIEKGYIVESKGKVESAWLSQKPLAWKPLVWKQ